MDLLVLNMLVGHEPFSNNKPAVRAPTRTYVPDAKVRMVATPAYIMEYPSSYVFVIDMPGLKSGDIKVQVEHDNVLSISGEKRKQDEKEVVKHIRKERRVVNTRKFELPENADTDKIVAVCQDGVLTITVEKIPPPKPRTIEVKSA